MSDAARVLDCVRGMVTYLGFKLLMLRPSEVDALTHALSPRSNRCPGPQVGLLGMFNANVRD